MIYFVVPRAQEFGIQDYMETWGTNLVGLVEVLHYEDLPEKADLPSGTYIFSALDQLTPGGRRLVGELQEQLIASLGPGRVLNRLDTVLLRFELLEELHRQGLNLHQAIRATGDLEPLRFPAFLHEEFRHSGAVSPLLFSHSQLQSAMGRAVLRGHRLNELLAVEFCDTADEEGLYRKYTAYMVGDQVIARTMARGREWMLKAGGVEFSEEMLLEERAYVFANPFEDQVRRVFGLAGIEYGRIDFAVQDGRVRTWEINTNPTVGPSRKKLMDDEFGPMRQPIRDHFSQRFLAALQALNHSDSAGRISIAYSTACLQGRVPLVHPVREPGLVRRAAQKLPPMAPLVSLMARILSPLLLKIGKRHW